ncbi:hypothetical protein [Natrinema salinisoli]|uniref:hypothetical protein n=1 Tax=Natrinema salinisoli TaxID=2878535 RepID=UPI001CF08F9B|nr:hypothetical protein [Natrinema salinisoli]
MCDDTDGSDDRDSSPPECPTCGGPVHVVTASSPYSGTVYPCGCSVNSVLVTTDPADRGLGTGN